MAPGEAGHTRGEDSRFDAGPMIVVLFWAIACRGFHAASSSKDYHPCRHARQGISTEGKIDVSYWLNRQGY